MQIKQVLIQVVTHLNGGLRADLSDSNFLKIFPTAQGTPELIPLTGPNGFFKAMNALDLIRIGTEECTESGHLEHRVWYPDVYRKLYSPRNLALPPSELWGALAHAAGQNGDAQSHKIMRHISFTLMAMGRRLLDVSDDYGIQLSASLKNGVDKDQKFSNSKVFDLFLNCHAFLAEACAARDYLARFLARHVYQGVEADSVAKLLKNKKSSSHPIDAILGAANDIANADPWMIRMNEYRDIITHRAPLTYLGGRNSMIQIRFQPNSEGKTLPRILAMIPADPFNLDSGDVVDALVLLHTFNARLLHFAAECARYSPYPPTLPNIDLAKITSLKRAQRP